MITRYCEQLGFPSTATKALTAAYETILQDKALHLLLQNAEADLFVPESNEWEKTWKHCRHTPVLPGKLRIWCSC